MLIALTPNSPNNNNNSVKATKGKPRPEPRPLSQTMTQERIKRHLLRTILLMIYDSLLGYSSLASRVRYRFVGSESLSSSWFGTSLVSSVVCALGVG